MKVVLLEDLVGRGRLGDVITVKDGFARNYLLPRRKALRATADNLEIFANRRADIEMRAAADRKAAMELAARAETLRLFLTAQAGPGGQLYGSVRPRQIAVALVEQGIAITPAQVVLRSPVRAIGRHAVELHFHADAVVFVDLYVGRSEESSSRSASPSSAPTSGATRPWPSSKPWRSPPKMMSTPRGPW